MSTLPIYKKLEDRNELDLRVEIYIDFCGKRTVNKVPTQNGYTYIDPNFTHDIKDKDGISKRYEFPIVIGYLENDEAYMLDAQSLVRMLDELSES